MSSTSSSFEDFQKQVKIHEGALAELNGLHSSRALSYVEEKRFQNKRFQLESGHWNSKTRREDAHAHAQNREDNQDFPLKRREKIKMVGSNYFANFFMIMVWAVFLLSSDLVIAKSQAPISEAETRQKKNDCYADIESGLWGQQCTSSSIARENCALRCLSPTCYELIYESDPLEEGEKDFMRSSEYKYCMHRVSLGESLDGIRGSFDH